MTKKRLAVSIAALGLAGAMAYVGHRIFGGEGLAIAVVVASPLIAFAVLAPLGFVASASVTLARQAAYRHIQGRHYEFKGWAIDVQEDLMSARWLRTSDVRKVLPSFPRDAALQKIFPEGVGYLETPKVVRISAASLEAYLQKATDPMSLRFREWLRRDVIKPSERWRSKHSAHPIGLPRDENAP